MCADYYFFISTFFGLNFLAYATLCAVSLKEFQSKYFYALSRYDNIKFDFERI